MAYRNKASQILKLNPDLVIIPECEHPDRLKNLANPTDIIWQGENINKGLGIFSYNDYRIKLLEIHDPTVRNILPISVTKGSINFSLLAVWAYNPLDRDYNYIGQVWKAINLYEKLLKNQDVIIVGDFNSNVFWDKLKRKTNHSMVVQKLAELNIFSTYHIHESLEQGKERHPTFFMYHHEDKPYHIDYCFASSGFLKNLQSFEIGAYQEWHKYSDHSPIIVTFKK